MHITAGVKDKTPTVTPESTSARALPEKAVRVYSVLYIRHGFKAFTASRKGKNRKIIYCWMEHKNLNQVLNLCFILGEKEPSNISPCCSLLRVNAVVVSQVEWSKGQAGDWKDTLAWTCMWDNHTWHDTTRHDYTTARMKTPPDCPRCFVPPATALEPQCCDWNVSQPQIHAKPTNMMHN